MNDLLSHPIRELDSMRKLIGGEPHPVAVKKIFDHVEPHAAEFISRSPFLLMSTGDSTGSQDVSPKGDGPGFVWLEDPSTLWIPERPGNKLAFGLINLLENPRIGLLFLLPGTEETVRINGRAELHAAPALLEQLSARGRPALLAIRVEVQECFFHCAKALKRSKLWQPDTWGERLRVSFGELLAPRVGGDASVVKEIDELVEVDYRERL